MRRRDILIAMDQIRPWVREWPANLKMAPAALMEQPLGKK
jgi:hypothetical protein